MQLKGDEPSGVSRRFVTVQEVRTGGRNVELRVYKKCQTSSGGDHYTRYEADLTIVPGEVRVEIQRAEPPDAYPEDVIQAREAIRAGAAKVLQPHGLGAVIQVRRVFIHDVDFKPYQFEWCTSEAIQGVPRNKANPDRFVEWLGRVRVRGRHGVPLASVARTSR